MLSHRVRRSLKFGGITPPSNKAATLRSRIMPMPLPARLLLPLQQYREQPAQPCVNVGDRVLKYQLIARGTGASGLNLHAPSSGTITAIDLEVDFFIKGRTQTAIELQTDGEDSALPLSGMEEIEAFEAEQIITCVEEAGVCGMGGAGFPSATKLRACLNQEMEYLLINAAECEPYISCDEALLRERASTVVRGAEVIQRACQARQVKIVIESDKADAIAALREALQASTITLCLVSPRYPAGEERQLLRAATGIEISREQLPTDVNCLVFNAGTAAAIYAAVIEGRPCISRIVSLSGAPLQTPKNFEALIGTPISHLLALCGIDKRVHVDTFIGGSMMGMYLPATSLPICKTTNSVVATDNVQFPLPDNELACIRCGYCADACPENLLPQQLLQFSRSRAFEQATDHGLDDCIECGACAYVCPSKIPLVHYYRAAKEEIAAETANKRQGEQRKQRFQYWQYRRKLQQEARQQERADTGKTASLAETNAEEPFSREKARADIAAAVARVKQKREKKD